MKKLLLAMSLLAATSASAQGFSSVEVHNQKVENTKEYTKGNIYQKDFLLLTDMIKNTHPAFTKQLKAPFNIDSMQVAGYKELKNCKNLDEFKLYAQRQIAKIHDGHTMLNLQPTAEWMSSLYPFQIDYTSDGYLLTKIDQKDSLALGKLVTRVNGVPVTEFIGQFQQYLSTDNETAVRTRVLRSGLANIFALVKNLPCAQKDSSLVLTMNDGQQVKLLPGAKSSFKIATVQPLKSDKQPFVIREQTEVPFLYKIDEANSIAYLQFNSCADQQTARNQLMRQGMKISPEIEKKLEAIPNFNETLHKMFNEVKAKDIRNVVVDVRQNGGGNSMLCSELLSWLYPTVKDGKNNPDFKTGPYGIRFSPLFEQFYKTSAEQIENNFKERNGGKLDLATLYNVESGYPFDFSKATSQDSDDDSDEVIDSLLYNVKAENVFKGNVFFIQDEATFSSATLLIQQALDNHIGKVIGGPSSMNASHFGDLLAWQLPNTKLDGQISHKMFLRPDMSRFNEKEIKLDKVIIPSKNDVLTGNDPCWEWVLNNVKR